MTTHHEQIPIPPPPLSDSELAVLREKADCGGTEACMCAIEEMGPRMYERLVDRLRSERYHEHTIGEVLDTAPLTEQTSLRHLIALWLYDSDTFYHSLRTYDLVTQALRRNRTLERAVTDEQLTTKHAQRAALLHDIGKLRIPRSVLTNHVTYNETLARLIEAITVRDNETCELLKRVCGVVPTADTVESVLQTHHKRPVHVLPASRMVSAEDLRALGMRGFETTGVSLMDIINQHEECTRAMLAPTHPIESEIAGHHHSPEKSGYPYTSGLVGATSRLASELMMALDEIDALAHPRAYRAQGSLVVGLNEVVQTARRGKISDFVAYHVLTTFINDISQEDRESHMRQFDTLAAYLREKSAPREEDTKMAA